MLSEYQDEITVSLGCRGRTPAMHISSLILLEDYAPACLHLHGSHVCSKRGRINACSKDNPRLNSQWKSQSLPIVEKDRTSARKAVRTSEAQTRLTSLTGGWNISYATGRQCGLDRRPQASSLFVGDKVYPDF